MFQEQEKVYILRFRKILLCDYLYYGLFLFSICFLLFILSIPKTSHYQEGFHTITGIVRDYQKNDHQYVLKVYAKEELIVYTDTFLYDIGDQVKISGDFFLPRKNTTSNLFNYQEYLKRKKTYYLVSSKSIQLVKKNHSLYYMIKPFTI